MLARDLLGAGRGLRDLWHVRGKELGLLSKERASGEGLCFAKQGFPSLGPRSFCAKTTLGWGEPWAWAWRRGWEGQASLEPP